MKTLRFKRADVLPAGFSLLTYIQPHSPDKVCARVEVLQIPFRPDDPFTIDIRGENVSQDDTFIEVSFIDKEAAHLISLCGFIGIQCVTIL